MQLTLAKPCANHSGEGMAASSEELAWYVAYTLPRHEKIVAAQLLQKQVETYLPIEQSARCWNGRRALVQVPLFPCYVFVRISLNKRVTVLEHCSVIRLVTFAGKPARLSDEEIQQLRTALTCRTAQPCPFFSPGKRVRIKSGPLCGLEGKIQRRKGHLRFVVSIDCIQRSIAFDLDVSDLALMN